MKVQHLTAKKGKVKKSVKTVWKIENLITMEKKYKDISKFLDEGRPAESDKYPSKELELIKVKNFVRRIIQHLKDVHAMANLFNVFGFAYLEDYLPKEKALELGYIL